MGIKYKCFINMFPNVLMIELNKSKNQGNSLPLDKFMPLYMVFKVLFKFWHKIKLSIVVSI
jgi:hypothetical protein